LLLLRDGEEEALRDGGEGQDEEAGLDHCALLFFSERREGGREGGGEDEMTMRR
jgi:hypothetical protein